MSCETLVSKYILSAEKVLREIRPIRVSLTLKAKSISKVVEYAKAYLEDAKYYKEQKKLDTSLTSVAYCEGLLDALQLLGAVEFQWPERTAKEEKC